MNYRLTQIGKIAFVVLFFVILLLPVFQMSTHFFKLQVLDENRTKERAPFFAEWRHPASFLDQSRKWFDDHYGFRDFLIRLKTQIDYSVFHVSDKVHIGSEGWLFFRTVLDIEKPAEEAMSEAELDAIVQFFAKLRDHLAEHHFRLVIVTNQMKDKFYPEYLPATMKPAKEHQRFDDFRAKLHALSGVTYIDTTEILMPLKSKRTVFHKTDFHWNDPAAAEVSRVIVDKIAALEGHSLPFWQFPLKIKTKNFQGGISTFMPLFVPPAEDELFIDQEFPASPFVSEQALWPFSKILRMKAAEGLLNPVVVFGDSFADGMERAGLIDHFKAYYRVRRDPKELKAVLSHLPNDADTFIFQYIETVMPKFLGTLARYEEY